MNEEFPPTTTSNPNTVSNESGSKPFQMHQSMIYSLKASLNSLHTYNRIPKERTNTI